MHSPLVKKARSDGSFNVSGLAAKLKSQKNSSEMCVETFVRLAPPIREAIVFFMLLWRVVSCRDGCSLCCFFGLICLYCCFCCGKSTTYETKRIERKCDMERFL